MNTTKNISDFLGSTAIASPFTFFVSALVAFAYLLYFFSIGDKKAQPRLPVWIALSILTFASAVFAYLMDQPHAYLLVAFVGNFLVCILAALFPVKEDSVGEVEIFILLISVASLVAVFYSPFLALIGIVSGFSMCALCIVDGFMLYRRAESAVLWQGLMFIGFLLVRRALGSNFEGWLRPETLVVPFGIFLFPLLILIPIGNQVGAFKRATTSYE
jgi:hypothetical protein